MKRFLIFLMSAVIVFTVPSEVVYASAGTEENNADWVSQLQSGEAYVDFLRGVVVTTGEVISFNTFIAKYSLSPILAVYDSTVGSIGAGMKYFMELVKAGRSPDDAKSYMQSSISNVDNSFSLTGDGLVYAQNYYSNGSENGTGKSLSDLGYTEFYIPTAYYLNPTEFATADIYNFCRNLLINNPDYYCTIAWYYGNIYRIYATKTVPLGAVVARQYWGDDVVQAEIYNNEWNTDFSINESGEHALLSVQTSYNPYNPSEPFTAYYIDSDGNSVAVDKSEAMNIDFDDILVPDGVANQFVNNGWYTISGSCVYGSPRAVLVNYMNDVPFLGQNMQGRPPALFHGGNTNQMSVIETYSTLNALKKGSVGLKTAALLPSYTGNGINNSPISDSTVQQAEEIINNYYDKPSNSGNGTGDNDNGDNDDGDNDDDDKESIWDKIGNALEGFLTVMGDLIAGLLEGITKIIPSIGHLFDGVKNLANNDFVNMLSAFFPFLPTEWFTVIGLGVGLVLLVFIVRVFKGG